MSNIYTNISPIRRQLNNELFPLTDGQRRSVGKLIRNECCNWVDGRCIALDCDCCPQMISLHLLCRWFQDCVLPLDPSLENEIFRGYPLKKCTECRVSFIPVSPHSKYCPTCSKNVRKAKNALDKRLSRSKEKEGRYVSTLDPGSIENSGITAHTGSQNGLLSTIC